MDLNKLLKPQSIAVVGVSEKPGFGRAAANGALNSKIKDRVYFVHPKREELNGKKCYRSITELPETVDCVVLCTPASTIAGLVKEAGEKGVGAAIIYASGFAEEGTEEGKALENEVKEIAKKYDMAILGPNCMGLINKVMKVNMWGGNVPWDVNDNSYGIGIVAQSGFVCAEIMGTGYFSVSYAVSSGNGNICTLEDFFDFMVEDENVSVVALYLEGVRNSEKFIESLGKAARKRKPVVILKAGRTEKGAAAAASHTGSMAGSNKAFESIFEKYGVIVAETFEEFVCLAQSLCVLRGNLPKGTKYGMISLSGGESTLSADVATELGVDLAALSRETEENIKKYIPSFASAKNPLDATTALFGDVPRTMGLLKAFNDDPEVAAITVGANVKYVVNPTMGSLCEAMARAVKEGYVTKPLFAVPSLENYREMGTRRILEDAGIPMMSSMSTAFKCLRKIAEFSEYNYEERTLTSCAPASHATEETEALTEFDSKEEMKKYGVPVPGQAIARSKEELKKIVGEMKAPLVLKINSQEILHKTDAGGVKLNVTGEAEAEKAYDEIYANIAKNAPNASTDGIVVQEMVKPGVEIIIGVTNDKQFGPMLLVGLGGIYVEIFKDSALYPAPMNKAEALGMIKKLKAYKLLKGYRGSKPCDIDALAEMMVKISRYAQENKDDLKEMDLNPVFVYEEGCGVCAVDALIVRYKD